MPIPGTTLGLIRMLRSKGSTYAERDAADRIEKYYEALKEIAFSDPADGLTVEIAIKIAKKALEQ